MQSPLLAFALALGALQDAGEAKAPIVALDRAVDGALLGVSQ